jgi:hypothetical protein
MQARSNGTAYLAAAPLAMLASARCELVSGQTASASLSGCWRAEMGIMISCCNVHSSLWAVARARVAGTKRGSVAT